VTLPDSVSTDHQKAAADLSKKTGKNFDKAYIDMQVKDHEKTVDLFEKGSKDVKDTELKTFIDNTLPKLKAHLDAAKSLKKAI
jgi:putative membrane protein